MAARDGFDFISITLSILSFIAAVVAAWFSWKTWALDKWRLEITLCQVDVERYGIGPPRIAYQFSVKNHGGRAVRVSSAIIIVDGTEIPLGQPNNNTKLESGDKKDFTHVTVPGQWLVIDDVYLFDQDEKRWSIDQRHLREMMRSEKTRNAIE